MAFYFNARIDDEITRIEFEGGAAALQIIDSKDNGYVTGETNSIYFLVKEGRLIYVGKTGTGYRDHSKKDFDQYIIISAPRGIDINYLEMYYINRASACGAQIINKVTPALPKSITVNKRFEAEDFARDVETILVKFGFNFFKRPSNNYAINTREKSFTIGDTRVDIIGNKVRIFINDQPYDGVVLKKLRELAKSANLDYSTWREHEQRGTIGFALRFMKELEK